MRKLGRIGCLFLFFLPFAAVGVVTGYEVLSHLAKAREASTWEEVPVRVSKIESGEKRSSGDDGVTSYITAEYSYLFNGKEFSGTKVGVDDQGGVGIAFDAREKLIKDSLERGKQIYCYVNSDNPSESVLFTEPVWDVFIFILLFALLFGGAGFGGIFFCFWSLKKEKETRALKERYFNEPWKWRSDWLENLIPAKAKFKVYGLWFFTIIWNLISSPFLLFIPGELEQSNYLALLVLLFPLVGLGLFALAIRSSIQHKKFGESKLVLEEVPAVVGGYLKGNIQFSSPMRFEQGVKVVLSCKQTTGSGDNRSVKLLWQSEKEIAQSEIGAGHMTGIPVAFAIPYENKASSEEDRVRWVLDEEELELKFVSFDQPPELKIIVSDLPNGKVITAPPLILRNTKMAIGALVFTVVWTSASIWLVLVAGMLSLVPIVFCLFSLVLIFSCLRMFFYKTELRVDKSGIKKHSQALFYKSNKFFSVSNIKNMEVVMNSANQSGRVRKAHYGIRLHTRDSKKENLIWLVNSKKTAYYLNALIKHELGLELLE